MSNLQIHLFKDSKEPFIKMLEDKNIQYRQHTIPPKIYMMSDAIIEIIVNASIWTALASCIIAWIKSRNSRSVLMTTKDDTILHIQGYSVKQVSSILKDIKDITVIDTSPNNGT